MKKIKITGKTSDGYHTFDELYEHRNALFCYAIRQGAFHAVDAIKNHYKGWDLLIAWLEDGDISQISYHLPKRLRRLWENSNNVIVETRNSWDGHTSKQVIRRLNKEC